MYRMGRARGRATQAEGAASKKLGFPEAQEQGQGTWVSVNREEWWGLCRACC